MQIIKEYMKKEVDSLNLDRVANDVAKRIKAVVNDKTVKQLCERSYNVKLGARPAMNVVHEFVDELVLSCADTAPISKTTKPVRKRHGSYEMRIPAIEIVQEAK